jgi:signal transduction histidine kinase
MKKGVLHGYLDPSLPKMDASVIEELNLHAASDLAKRNIPGSIIVLLAFAISAFSSDFATDKPIISFSIVVILGFCIYARLTLLRSLKHDKTMTLDKWRPTASFVTLITAITWGLYSAISLACYGYTSISYVILLFSVGIAGGASNSLFIWRKLAITYLAFVFVPPYIITLLNIDEPSLSMLYGFTAYFIFLIVQINRSNQEYWLALCNTVLLEHQKAQLIEAKVMAERANAAKSEFLSSMSHELRTPLNAITGFTQLMLSDPITPPNQDQRENLEYISDAGKHLLNLVNQVLDLAKIEMGELELKLKSISLSSVVDECIPLIEGMAKEQGILLSIAPPPEHDQIVTDPLRLKQVLINLLSNAIKYNKESGSVTMNYEIKNEMLKVSVTDNGIGIPEDKLQFLFLSFSRLGHDKSTIEGSGVGLAITKRIVEAMNGQIGVNSVEGQGSTFWFTIPLDLN